MENKIYLSGGEKLLEQFSHDMRQEFPEMGGFSIANLKRMRLFAITYPELEIGAQLVHQLPWGHIIVLLHRVKNADTRLWYIQKVIEFGWSRAVLEMQIEAGLYERQGISSHKINNFHEHLPAPQSDLANQLLKDPYKFDFLTFKVKQRNGQLKMH